MTILSQEFLSQFRGIRPANAGPTFEVTVLGKYSLWLPELKRRERWDEICERVVEYNISLYQGPATHDQLVKEAETMYINMFNLLSLPAGRTMRIGGTKAAEAFPESNFNCCFTKIECLEDFCEVFHLTMCSCGVGFDGRFETVQSIPQLNTQFIVRHDVYNTVYPRIRQEHTTLEDLGFQGKSKVYKITVGDSKLGWVDSLRKFLNLIASDFSQYEIVFNYDYVRPEGSRLMTWGGLAAGPDGLVKMFDNLTKIIGKSSGKLKPVDVLDICTYIAKNVVVGGTRRAALIYLFSPNDLESRHAKRILGYFGWAETGEPVEYEDYNDIKLDVEYTGKIRWFANKEYEHRTMSNNTIVFDNKPTFDELKGIFRSIRHNGEPGFFNKKAASKRRPNCEGLNPCKPSNSLILTPNGYITFKQALEMDDLTVILPSGKEAKATKPFKTGANREVYKIRLSNGQDLYGTSNHQHQLLDGQWKEVSELKIGDKLKYENHAIFDVEIDDNDQYELGILAGWIHGDGSLNVRSDSAGYSTQMCIGSQEFDIRPTLEKISNCEFKPHNQKPATCMVTSSHDTKLANKLLDCGYSLDKNDLTWLYGKNADFKLGFIRALFTADGSVRKHNNVELYSARKEALSVIQNILREFGIDSTLGIHNNAKSYIAKDNKVRNNSTSYKLNVYRGQFTKIGFLSKAKNELLSRQVYKNPYRFDGYLRVDSIELHSVEDVYDITVMDDCHSFIDTGIVTHNCGEILLANKGVCNLSTVIMPNHIKYVQDGTPFIDYESLEAAVRLAVRVGLRQTNVTMSLPEWDKTQKRDRLIGPSKTGEMDFLDILGIETNSFAHTRILETMNFWANDEADRYSFEMRVPRSLLVTTIKPEGTLSLLSNVSPGMHRSFAPYYVRRFKFASFDPICKALTELGVPYEKDQTKSDSNRLVFTFPIKSSAKCKAIDESFESQFNRYLCEQKYYTDHNTSCTLYVGRDEWDQAAQLVYDNWDEVIAVSFLPKDEGVYPQAPFQAITEEEYNSYPQIDYTKLGELVSKYESADFQPSSMDEQEECPSGVCPI